MNYSSDFYYVIEDFEKGLELREKTHDFLIAKGVLDIAIKYTEELLYERASIIALGSDPENYYFQMGARYYSKVRTSKHNKNPILWIIQKDSYFFYIKYNIQNGGVDHG